MIEILSSILASDLLSVGVEVQRMLDNGVDSLHVDIMDAHFVPNLSFGPAMVSALKKAGAVSGRASGCAFDDGQS